MPTVRLTEIFRQAARSLIVRAAHAINAGEPPPTDGRPRRRARLLRRQPRTSAEAIVRRGRRARRASACPATTALDPRADVLVLAPMHRGPVGRSTRSTRALRARAEPRRRADPRHARCASATASSRPQRPRARADERRARRARRTTTASATASLLASDDGRRLTLPAPTSWARCASPTRSRSTRRRARRRPAIVVVLHRGHRVMLTRNLLYTAVTRAERVCVVVGEPAALQAALGRRDAAPATRACASCSLAEADGGGADRPGLAAGRRGSASRGSCGR